ENRFAFLPPESQVPPDGIIILGGSGTAGIAAVSALSQQYPKARFIFSGFSAADDENLIKRGLLGVDPARVYIEPRPRTTSEDALYAAILLNPQPRERWLLVTLALHMSRAVGCFRVAGFQVVPYQVGAVTEDPSGPFAYFRSGAFALGQFDTAAKEWFGLVA